MNSEWIDRVVDAEVERVELYGIYLRFSQGEVIVLIPDVSYERIPDLTKKVHVGDRLLVKILEYVEDRHVFKGTIKDVGSDVPV